LRNERGFASKTEVPNIALTDTLGQEKCSKNFPRKNYIVWRGIVSGNIFVIYVLSSLWEFFQGAPLRIKFLSVLLILTSTTVLQASPVQWTVAQGGNGSYFDWVPGYLTWTQADAAASQLTFDGIHGYLATVTSQQENNFFETQFSQSTGQTLIGWLGGYKNPAEANPSDPSLGWNWVTGQPWSYTSWWTAEGLPDNAGGNQNYLRTQPVGSVVYWDDIQNDPGSFYIGGYFVEYAVPEPGAASCLFVVALLGVLRRIRVLPR
jgi:hypothetical protein